MKIQLFDKFKQNNVRQKHICLCTFKLQFYNFRKASLFHVSHKIKTVEIMNFLSFSSALEKVNGNANLKEFEQ